jgi:diguanylate cyclase (GGDEF)-like protein
VSRILTSSIRRGDIAARYGGDEFCLLLHGAGIEEAMEVAGRIRERVSALYPTSGNATVSISIGVATLADHGDGRGLLASADGALYAAKEGGRDRVVRADTLQEAPPLLTTQL